MSFVRNKIIGNLNIIGIDLLKMGRFFKGLDFYLKDRKQLVQQKGLDNKFPMGSNKPMFEDRFDASGAASGHYFHQDLVVARKIHENKPLKHVDIGSRTDGFVAHVAVFREIEVFDIRQQKSNVKNIVFKQADLMQLPENMHNYCDSVSALHSIEHFGLGRYGDPIDYSGHERAIQNITKVLKKDGVFYFSVPIGPQRINFNAHRVFSVKYLLELLKKDFELKSFSYVNDKGDLVENITLNEENIQSNCGCQYGCGIFELVKK
ncbi:MAG: DUF268 domain-containing protein [Paludibacter sp.]